MRLLEALGRRGGRRILVWALGAIALWAVLGFLVLPPFLRPVLEKRFAEVLHRPVRLHRLSLNPFTLSATLEGLDVKAKDGAGPFFSFERLHVNFEAISLLEGGPVIREVVLTKPSILVVRSEDGRYEFQDLLDEAMKPPKKNAALRFSVNNIRVESGSIDFDDRPKRVKHQVRGLRIGIPFLSNIASKVEISTVPSLEANVNGSSFELHGKTKPFSETRETTLDIVLHDLDLPSYLAYAPAMPSTITSGRLDARIAASFAQPLAGPPTLSLSGTSVLRKLAVAHRGEPLVACDRLDAVLGPIDVFGRKAHLASLRAARPEFWIRRGRSGDFEAATALVPATDPSSAREAGVKAPAGPPYLLEIDEMGIEDGRVHYDDLSLSAPFRGLFGSVTASAKGFSTAPGKAASLNVSANGDAGEILRANATVALEPLALEGALEIGSLPLKRYAGFLDPFLAFAVDDGVLDLKTKYRFSTGKDGVATLSSLSGLSGVLKSPRLRKRGEKGPFFVAPSVTMAGSSLDFDSRGLVLGEIASTGGFLAVVRGKDGNADLAELMAGPPERAPASGAAPVSPAAAWKFASRKIALDGYTVKIEDWAVPRPARYSLTKMSLLLENVSSAPGEKAKLRTRFGVDGKGMASAQGPFGFRPVFADLRVAVKGIDLVPLEPYVLQDLRLSLAHGTVSGAGSLSFREGKDRSTRVTYTGGAQVSGFRALDGDTKLDFLRWDTFSVTGMKAGYNPIVFEVAEMAVSGVACDVSIESDGTLNLRKVLGMPSPPEREDGTAEPSAVSSAAPSATPTPVPTKAASAAGGPAEVMPIRIDVLTLQNGRIGLADHLINPSYSATLMNVAGRVAGLSSQAGTVATIDLSGSLASHSPLRVTGSINPLAASASADIQIAFRDIDLPQFTPYSGKYAGYRIARGSLTIDVSYKLENQKLTAQNHFLVDQFELGEKVESKDATKLPVKLAVSLLKDRNGLIDLDLPIEGSLDDPKFRLGKVIWKVLGNLIGRAATAPFALLGKLFGGGSGQEFSYVDFSEGRDVLDDAARKKLDNLAKALSDRPGLKLDVAGRTSGEKDLEALKRIRLDRKLKAWKLDDLAKKGAASTGVDDVGLEKKEYAAYLEKAYRTGSFQKPRNVLGGAKGLPVAEMEKLLLANLPVTDDDLRQLALARANAVKDYLAGPGKVEAARVFVREPRERPAEPKEGVSGSRADFSFE